MSYNIPKMLNSEFQSPSIKIQDSKLILLIILTLLAPRGGVKILNVLLGMSYNIPKILSSEFQSCSIKIEEFKINPIHPFNPNSIKGGSKNVKPITRNVL